MSDCKKEHIHYCFCIFAILHIVLGFMATAVSLAGIGVDVGYIDELEEERGQTVKYILLGLDASSVVGSVSFVISGLLTCCMTCCGASLVRTKVSTMVCSILAASVFSPILIGASVTGYILRGSHERKFVVVPAVLTGLAVMELFLSLVTAIYCCKSAWHIKRHSKDKLQMQTDEETENKEKGEKEKNARKAEKKEKKEIKKQEKAEREKTKKEKKDTKEEKGKDKQEKVKIALIDDSDLSEVFLNKGSEQISSVPPPYKF